MGKKKRKDRSGQTNAPLIQNRKARHDFHILETVEAGIELRGSEVKSLRAGKASLKEAHAKIEKGEAILYGMHIAPYEHATYFGHEPTRPRRLLLHRREIDRLFGYVREPGYTLVPLKLYFNARGVAKLELALAKGKRMHDKREAMARRDAQREIERAVKEKARS